MLQGIRERSQSWVSYLIIIGVSLTFCLWGISSYLQGNSVGNAAAKVDGKVISNGEVNRLYERLVTQARGQLGPDFALTQKLSSQLKKQALESLIKVKVLSQSAYKAGYRVSPDDIRAYIVNNPAFAVDGKFSPERFRAVVNNVFITEDAFLKEIRSVLLVNQVQLGLTMSAFSLPSEVEHAIGLVSQQRSFDYLTIPTKRLQSGVHITDAEVQQYYNNNKAKFRAPEKVSVSYVELSVEGLMNRVVNKIAANEGALKSFYENNRSDFNKPEQWHVAHILIRIPRNANAKQLAAAKEKADSVLAKLNKGDSFSTLAREYSSDIATAKKGGVLPWFGPQTGMASDYVDIANSLNKPGQLSPVTRTKYGFAIVKLLAKKKAEPIPFATAKHRIIKLMAQQKAEQQFANLKDRLSDLTFSNPSSLDMASKQLDLKVQTTALFDRKGAAKGLAHNPKVVEAAFSNDVLAQNNNSDVLEIGPGQVIVLRIAKHQKASQLPLAQVKTKIDTTLRQQAVSKLALKQGKRIVEMLNAGNSEADVAKQFNLDWHHASNIKRNNIKLNAEMVSFAFQLPHPTNKVKTVTQGEALDNGDYLVVSLKQVTKGKLPEKATALESRIFNAEVERSHAQLDYESYLNAQMAKAKIVRKGDNS